MEIMLYSDKSTEFKSLQKRCIAEHLFAGWKTSEDWLKTLKGLIIPLEEM